MPSCSWVATQRPLGSSHDYDSLIQAVDKLRTHQTEEVANPISEDTYLEPPPRRCADVQGQQERAACVSDLNQQLYAAADGTQAMFLDQDTQKAGAGAAYYDSEAQKLLNAGRSTV
jgi:hypothetical protein